MNIITLAHGDVRINGPQPHWQWRMLQNGKQFGRSRPYCMSAEIVRGFAELTGDWNEIHFDATAAKRHGLPSAIVHGALINGFLSRVCFNAFGHGTLLGPIREAKPLQPVPVGGWIRFLLLVHRRGAKWARLSAACHLCGDHSGKVMEVNDILIIKT